MYGTNHHVKLQAKIIIYTPKQQEPLLFRCLITEAIIKLESDIPPNILGGFGTPGMAP